MPRSVNHAASRARRKKLLNRTKGYFGARKNVWTAAKNTWEKGQQYAYRDRKVRKRDFRSLWITRINAAVRMHDMSYSQFIHGLNKAGITLDRKILSDMAINDPASFAKIVEAAKAAIAAA